jgi:hypothetical protein
MTRPASLHGLSLRERVSAVMGLHWHHSCSCNGVRLLRLLLLAPALFAAAPASSLQFVPYPQTLVEQQVVPLANGSVLIVGWANGEQSQCVNIVVPNCSVEAFTQGPSLVILDSSGVNVTPQGNYSLGSGDGRILDAAVDANGNIWLVGVTSSDDYELLNPLFNVQKLAYHSAGFIAKLDPNLNLLFSTFIGGQEGQSALTITTPTNVVLDTAGNAYIAGHTGEPDFPITAVFGEGSPVPNLLGVLVYGFVAKISADATHVVYGHLIGGDRGQCSSPMQCTAGPAAANTIPYALAVDASGQLTVAGSTDATDFPVTAGAYQSACACRYSSPNGFLTRVSADGTSLIWSTFLGLGAAQLQSTYVQSIALDSSDDVYIAGEANAPIAATPGALQTTFAAGELSSGYAAKLSSDGTKVLYATNLGGSNGSALSGLTLDSAGNLWIAGHTNSPDFPGLSSVPNSGVDFALQLNADASALTQFVPLVTNTVTQPPAFDSSGRLLLLASSGNLLRLNPEDALTTPALWAVTNAATLTASPGVESGEIASFFGIGLGPSTGLVGTPDANGLYPTELGGVTIEFGIDGLPPIPAPLLYVGSGQINFQVPFRFLGTGNVTVTTPTGTLPPMQMVPQITSLGIFRQSNSNFAAALDQNLPQQRIESGRRGVDRLVVRDHARRKLPAAKRCDLDRPARRFDRVNGDRGNLRRSATRGSLRRTGARPD